MPVAPFKENKTEEGDGNRHLIYAKRNTGTRPQKGVRVKDYSEVSVGPAADTIKKSEEEVIKVDNNHDVRKTNKMNRAHTKGRAPPIPKRRPPSEESPVQSPRSPETNDNQWTDLLKPTSPRIEDSQPEPVTLVPVEPPKPSKAPRTFFHQPEGEPSADLERKQTVSLSVPEEMKMETEDIKTEETKTETTESNEPVRGIPSIIAKRLKQNAQNQNADSATQSRPPGELFGVVLGKTRHEDDSAEEASEIPCKRLTPAAEKPAKDTTSNLPSEIENQIASVRKRMEQGSKNKPSGPSIIFDSSQLHKKRREKQAAKSSAQVGVPRLDLSGITSEDSSNAGSVGGYRVTPREIKPCNIEFIGGNVSIGRSMLEKKRSVKINIQFHEVLVETFEYPSEETMLEEYLREHPNEVLILEEVSWPTESSDDSDIPETPRGGGGIEGIIQDGELLKSNTSLAHSGSLQSYRSKFQVEYELGSVLNEPEKPPEPPAVVESVDPDSMQLRPADEDDTQTWSTDTSADLLF